MFLRDGSNDVGAIWAGAGPGGTNVSETVPDTKSYPATGGGKPAAMSELFAQFGVDAAGMNPYGPTDPSPVNPTEPAYPGQPGSPGIPKAPGVPKIPEPPPGGFPKAPPSPATGAGGGGIWSTISGALVAIGSTLADIFPPVPKWILPGNSRPEA